MAAGIVVLVVVVVGVQLSTGKRHVPLSQTPAAYVEALTGEVISLSPTNTISYSDPARRHQLSFDFGRDLVGSVAVSPDQRFIATDRGALISLSPGGPTLARMERLPAATAPSPLPFANGDQAIVASVDAGAAENTQIYILGGDGSPISLGRGDAQALAGDPQTVGVIVSVPAAIQPSTAPLGGGVGLVDTSVQWRSADAPPLTLATRAQLNADAQQPQYLLVHLGVYPDPSGNKIAVVVEPPGGGSDNAAIVVIDRHGHRLASVPAGPGGPTEYIAPSWSSDGSALVYPTLSQYGSAVAIWHPGHSPVILEAPDPGLQFHMCIWGPNDNFLCTAASGNQGGEWVFGSTRSTTLDGVPNASSALAWISST